MFKLVVEKAEEPEIKLPTSTGSSKKQESSRKTSNSALLTTPKPSTVWITVNCGKFWKRWEYQTTWPASWESCMQVRKQQLNRTCIRKHLTKGFLCAVLDLSGTLWPLLIPEYSGIKRRGTPGLRNPGISHYSDKYPLPYYEPNGKRWLFATFSLIGIILCFVSLEF